MMEWERTLVMIDRLASIGSKARMPFSRSLGEGLFEVRFTLGSTARRITHRFTNDDRIAYRLTTTTGSFCSPHSVSNATTNEPRSLGLARSLRTALAVTRRRRQRWPITPAGKTSRRPKAKPSDETWTAINQDLDLGQLLYDMRTEAGLSQRELAERMETTQSAISRLEEGGGAKNRIETLALNVPD